jgi:hypothetical protein
MASGADLLTAGVQIADLLDESGAVDPDKAQAAVAAVLTERPHCVCWQAVLDQAVEEPRERESAGRKALVGGRADLRRLRPWGMPR